MVAVWIPPVVVVVEDATAQVAAVLPNEGLVGVAHTGVDAGDHAALAVDAQGPGVRCLDVS